MIQGYMRKNGQKGIRNTLVIVYLVECAHHVARSIVNKVAHDDVQLIGFPGCYPNEYALTMMERLCTHPNVGGAMLLSLGCEGFNREQLEQTIKQSGRPAHTLIIQESGGTLSSIQKGTELAQLMLGQMANVPLVNFHLSDLVVGTICGGSDGTSGITANPAVGLCFDQLVANNAICIFEETGELIGCEHIMAERAATPEISQALLECVAKAEVYYTQMGYGSFAPGNAEGGLTTQEEKSLGAYAKSGASQIQGIIKPGQKPANKGLYLLDVVPDGEPMFGFPNIADNQEIVEMIACGCHCILFTTGRGSVVGSAISPVIKICANPETFRTLEQDMDINAGSIIDGSATLVQVGQQIFELIVQVANGQQTKSEALGHKEFLLTYKRFNQSNPAPSNHKLGPTCLS